MRERNASAREKHPTRDGRDAAEREKNEGLQTKPKLLTLSVAHFSISPPRPAFLAWGDFHARSRFTRSTIPEERWGLLIAYLRCHHTRHCLGLVEQNFTEYILVVHVYLLLYFFKSVFDFILLGFLISLQL